jgi:hypothetical protein
LKQEGSERRSDDRQRRDSRQRQDQGSIAVGRATASGQAMAFGSIRVNNGNRAHGRVEAFDFQVAGIHVGNAVKLGRKMDDRLGRERFACGRAGTQTGGKVERCSSKARSNGDGFTSVQANAYAKRQTIGHDSVLEVDRSAERLARGNENDQCLVTAQLEQESVARRYDLFDNLAETTNQLRAGLVTAFTGVGRVTANVGDQERAQFSRLRCTRRRGFRSPL